MTPTEAIASIRASRAAGLSPRLSDIEVLIAECGRVRALEAQLIAKDEALRPFAEFGQWLFARPNIPNETSVVESMGINGYAITFTRGHFKAAHTALTATPQPAQEQKP